MAVDTFVVYTGVYASVEDAEADYQTLKDLHTEAGLLDAYDAAVIARNEKGKVKITKKHETPTRVGGVLGGGIGLATGLVVALFPFAAIGGGLLVGTTAGGALLGSVAGHAAGGMSRHDLKELGEELDAGEAGLDRRRGRQRRRQDRGVHEEGREGREEGDEGGHGRDRGRRQGGSQLLAVALLLRRQTVTACTGAWARRWPTGPGPNVTYRGIVGPFRPRWAKRNVGVRRAHYEVIHMAVTTPTPTPTPQAAPQTRAPRRHRRRPWISIVAIGAGVLLLGAAGLWKSVAVDALVKFPTDVNLHPQYQGTLTTFIDPSTAAPLATPTVVPLQVDRTIAGVPAESTDSRVLVQETFAISLGGQQPPSRSTST